MPLVTAIVLAAGESTRMGAAKALLPDPDGRPFFIGTADQVTGDLRRLAAAGAEHFVLRFWAGNPAAGIEDSLDQMERFAERVRPRFEATR